MADEFSGKAPTTRAARYIRFTAEELEQLVEDENRSGQGAAALLKKAYFGSGRVVLLMTDEDKRTLLVQIQRIGNNVNQIAKKLNSGFMEGFNAEIVDVRRQLTALLSWVAAKYSVNRAGTRGV